MSSAAPWLSRQRKTDLSEMAEAAGMSDYKSLKKDDLQEQLDEFLSNNQSTLASNPKLAGFYKRMRSGSPEAAGKELAKTETKTPSKPRRRTIAPKETKEDATSESEAPANASTLRTPARQSPSALASQIPLPVTPAQVADKVMREQARASAWLSQQYTATGIQKHIESARDAMSTSYAITTLSVALEVLVLLATLLPMRYLGLTIPAVPALYLSDYHLKGPNLWNLLEQRFWATTFLWSSVSVLLPGLAAYFCNMTLKARKHGHGAKALNAKFDPFTFNVAKALCTWLVFVHHIELPTDALVDGRLLIASGMPGGYLWTMIAAGVGALVSLYEAVLRQ